MPVPYVVSLDVAILIAEWARTVPDFPMTPPDASFYRSFRSLLTEILEQMFPVVELISEDELVFGLERLMVQASLTPVVLDGVYVTGEYHLECTRSVDPQNHDLALAERADSSPLLTQLECLRSAGLSEVVLVDDVVYTGESVEKVVCLLDRIGIRVPVVIAGVGVGAGINRLQKLGIEVLCVRQYGKVIDQVCERDFFPGVNRCGRLLWGSANIGVPYILPFGDPCAWASIPSNFERLFSEQCLKLTIELFKEIGRRSSPVDDQFEVMTDRLTRKVTGLPAQPMSFVSFLRECLEKV